MKNAVRFFCILIIGITVFMGALLIGAGTSAKDIPAAQNPPAAAQEETEPRENIFRSIEQSSEGNAI